jgi:glucose dehydrogenase
MARIAPIAAAVLLGLVALRAASSDPSTGSASVRAQSRTDTQDGQWRRYSADNGSTKYSPLDQINRSNVAQLKVAWRHPQAPPDIVAANPGLRLNNNYRATPIMVDGVL